MPVEVPSRDTNRPYPPASNVIAVLRRLRSRNLPDRIDYDFLRDAGIAESLIHRVAFALRFLNLVEDDAPTPALRAIATSTDEEYHDILANLIRESYQEAFAVIDPAQDSQDRIVNFFRRYTPASQRERMVNFFLAMCREAGMQTLDVPRQRATDGAVPVRATKRKSMQSPGSGKKQTNDPAPNQRSEEGPQGNVPAALELLVRSLPPEGSPMSAAKRDQWLTMAGAALAFIYPEETSVEEMPDGQEEG